VSAPLPARDETPSPARTPAALPSPVPVSVSDGTARWVVYEVGVEVAPEKAAEFDAWLPAHVDQIVALPGFLQADVYTRDPVAEGDRHGWLRRTIQYRLREPADLDSYLAVHAPLMRQAAIERFGDRVFFDRRALQHRSEHLVPVPAAERCSDCGAALTGPYCWNCGQRVHSHVLTLWTLIKEAAEDLTHADSRVWRTLHALLFRPGLLTNEFLAGRRTRYVRPFRLYLVVSIAYFLLIGLKGLGEPDEAIKLDKPVATLNDIQTANPEEAAQARAQIAEARRQLEKKGVTLPILPGEERAPAAEAPASQPADKCDPKNMEFDLPISEKRYRALCSAITADNGRRFVEALFHNVPKMMFVFLPLIAAVNMLFYPFRRRYYVVHLLFFIHYHAFVFLAFTLQSGYDWIAKAIPYVGWTAELLVAVMVFYLPIYLFKAMRRVFGQGRLMTLLKFLLLSQAYFVCLLVMFVLLLIYTGVTLASG
jgi:hypothetical protein